MRYVITTPPSASGDIPPLDLPEHAEVRLVSRLDRGLLVDADEARVRELEEGGLRVRAVPEPDTLELFGHRIDTASGTTPDVPEAFRLHPEQAGPGGSADATEEAAGARDTRGGGVADVNHLVQLVGPVQESWLTALGEQDVRVVEAVGRYGYLVRGDAATVEGLRSLPFVAWTGRLEPAYKVNPALLDVTESDPPPGLGPVEALDVGVLADGDVDGVVALVEELGGAVHAVSPPSADAFRSLTAELPADGGAALATLAARADVRWVDVVRTPLLEDERTAQIVYEDLDGTAPPGTAPVVGYQANLTALGVDGTGVTVAVCDTGVDTNVAGTVHGDLAGRLAFAVNASTGAAPAGADTNGHGTHVAGIVAGDGGAGGTDPGGFALGVGVAPGAQVGGVVFNGTRQQRIEQSVRNGAQVMNNSWSMDGAAYGAGERTFDLGVRDADPASADLEELTVVFSAGNSGPGAQTLTKAMKNAVVVGNSLNFRPGEGDTDDIRGLRSSSSRGPAADGRLLPHVVAPGTDVVSARSAASGRPTYVDTGGTAHAGHTVMSGTSMAAPHVAGQCALLIDWWRQTRGGATPSPALLKALLVNSTEPVAGGTDGDGGTIAAGPTTHAGWGRISLENALLQTPASDRGPKIFLDQRHAFTATGQEYLIRVAAPEAGLPLRVTLAWTDAPGAVGANPALVNDLDLEVRETATGRLFRGNVFAGGFSTTGGVADTLNNLEGVVVENPTGVYEVSVVASTLAASARPDVATPWQDFALVLDNAEVPAAAPVSVVTVLDRSGSMQAFGYVDVTRQASRQFVDLLSIDDSVGVVSFGDAATEEFPGTGAPAPITDAAVRTAARNAVDGIAFGGCTYMGDGIRTAGTMLAGAGDRRAAVLLSDGYDNKGCSSDPARPSALDAAAALPADLPLYTCAMGPASDQSTLEQLATDTDGRYYYMPTIDDLFEIYNYVRGQVTGEGVIVNESSTASVSTVSGFVDACAEAVTFTVAWHEPALRYVADPPRRDDEIAVRLRTPGGRWLPRSATEALRRVGTGYVSLVLEDPEPGLWTVEVSTARRQHTPYTVGGFVRSPISLTTAADPRVALGEPMRVKATVADARGPLDGVRAVAVVTSPQQGVDDARRRWADALAKVQVPRDALADGGKDPDRLALVQLTLLRDQLLAETGQDILPRVSRTVALGPDAPGTYPVVPYPVVPAPMRGHLTLSRRDLPGFVQTGPTTPEPGSAAPVRPPVHVAATAAVPGLLLDPRRVRRPRPGGTLVGDLGRTKVPGSTTVRVTATGYSPVCRSRFVRTDLVTVLAVEKG